MKILYFAWLRGKVGRGEEDIALPAEIRRVDQLIAWLKEQSPGHAEAFAQPTLIRVAVNQDYAGLDHPVGNADEVAFFPPVTGG
jgi:sulfur-carrier protein